MNPEIEKTRVPSRITMNRLWRDKWTKIETPYLERKRRGFLNRIPMLNI
jgi:hypothetical protein